MARFSLPLAALLLIAAPALPLAAQDAPAAVQADPYLAFVLALEGAVDGEVMLQRMLAEAGHAMRTANPDLAALEAEYPGIIDDVVAAMTPMIRQHSQFSRVGLNRDLAAVVRDNFTAQQARDATAFYTSPLGRRVLLSLQNNWSSQAILEEAVFSNGEGDISSSAVSRDLGRTGAAAIADLSAADRAQIERQLRGASWPASLSAMQPQMIAARARAENTPMDPALEAEMGAAILAVVERRTGQALKPQAQPARGK